MKKKLILLLLLTASFCGAKDITNLLSKLDPVPPFPEVQKEAKALGIPLDRISYSDSDGALATGDSITALITLHQKGNRRTQWLVYFQIMTPSNSPSSKPPRPVVLYNSMGDKFEFPSSPATFRIRALGPYVDTASIWGEPVPKDKYAQASVDGGFLGLGMDQAAMAVHRITVAGKETGATNFDFWASDQAPKPPRIQRNQKLAAQLHITKQEERVLAGWYPALESYFEAVGETPNLDGIMWKIVSLPSMWSMVKHAGITAWIGVNPNSIAPISLPRDWDLPVPTSVYTLPMWISLNNHDALNATLFLTSPRPPLLACGGIVGFIAQNPDDDEDYMTLRVISAHCGTNSLKQARAAIY